MAFKARPLPPLHAAQQARAKQAGRTSCFLTREKRLRRTKVAQLSMQS